MYEYYCLKRRIISRQVHVTFNSRVLQAFLSIPVLTRWMLVTSRSSPTHWTFGMANVTWLKASQASCSNGSSMLITGNFSVKLLYIDVSSSTVTELEGSDCGFLKSRSYLPYKCMQHICTFSTLNIYCLQMTRVLRLIKSISDVT